MMSKIKNVIIGGLVVVIAFYAGVLIMLNAMFEDFIDNRYRRYYRSSEYYTNNEES